MIIVEFVAENIKRLKAVRIKPAGSVVQITGANGSGKTSVLDAIFWALGGKSDITSKPVRNGEASGEVLLDLGEMIVRRKFTPDGESSLVVEAETGARFSSPQKVLDALLGSLSFDPLAFTRMKPKEQLDTLKGLVHLDVDLDALDKQSAQDYLERTAVNRRAAQAKEREGILRKSVDSTMDVAPIDVSALMDEMQAASRHNLGIEQARAALAAEQHQAARFRDQLATKREMIARMIEEADHLEQQAAACDARVQAAADVPEPIDLPDIRGRVDAAQTANAKRQTQATARRDHERARVEALATAEESDALTKAIDERQALKAQAIAAATMPIDGLSFGAGEVLYNGLPFDQASGAEQLRVSVAIAMAGNPKLRVLRIKDGSLLDEKSLALLAELAEKNDWQVWIERVQVGGPVGIEMYDGEIKAIDGAPQQMELV